MKNLAGVPADKADPIILAELTEAGIGFLKLHPQNKGEISTSYWVCLIEGTGWEFSRAWRYWVARWQPPCKPITMEQANRLFASHGSEVRCGGSCLGPSPEKEFGKDGIPYFYHVDTQAGLNELVKIILENRTIPQEA